MLAGLSYQPAGRAVRTDIFLLTIFWQIPFLFLERGSNHTGVHPVGKYKNKKTLGNCLIPAWSHKPSEALRAWF